MRRVWCFLTFCSLFPFGLFASIPIGLDKINKKKNLFVGRKSELAVIQDKLAKSHFLTIIGVEGIGKSSLALQYASLHAKDYDVIWWFDGTSSLIKNHISLAKKFSIPTKKVDFMDVMTSLRKQIVKNSKIQCLFIYDNIEAPTVLKDYLPDFQECKNIDILVTSCSNSAHWENLGDVFTLGNLKRADSVKLLCQLTKKQDETHLATKLADHLCDLPIALKQAGAYILETGTSMQNYMRSFEVDEQKEVIWRATLEKIEKENPEALELLQYCSYLNYQTIPAFLIERFCTSSKNLKKSTEQLRRYSLLEKKKGGFSMHAFLQRVIQSSMSPKQQQQKLIYLLHKLNLEFAYYRKQLHVDEKYRVLLPHITHVLDIAQKKNIVPQLVSGLLHKLGNYVLYEQNHYTEADRYLKQSLKIEKEINKNPKTIARVLFSLGTAKERLGQFDQAKAHFHEALKILKGVYKGEEHFLISSVYHGLAKTAFHENDYMGSQEFFEKALAINRRFYGNDDHFTIGRDIHWLGRLSLIKGDFSEAIELFHKAIDIERSIHETDVTPYTSETYLCLGKAHFELNHFTEAKRFFKKALEVEKQVYSNNPSSTLGGIYHWLGKTHLCLGDLDEGKYYLREALFLHMLLLRTQDHLQVASTMRLLGRLALIQSDYRSARAYFEKVAKVYKKFHLKKSHPREGKIFSYLARLEVALGNFTQAKVYFEKSLELFQGFGGRGGLAHRIAPTLAHLGWVELELDHYSLAKKHFQKAKSLALKAFSSEKNRSVPRALCGLGKIALQEGFYNQAQKYFIRAEEIYRYLYKRDAHVDIAEVKQFLGELAYKRGEYSHAREIFAIAYDLNQKALSNQRFNLRRSKILTWQARIDYREGKFQEAEKLLQEANEIAQVLYPKQMHVDEALAKHFLGDVFWAQGKYAEAEASLEKAIECYQHAYGDIDHSNLIDAWTSLGKTSLSASKYKEARTYLTKALHLASRREYSSIDVRKGKVYFWLGCLEKKEGNLRQAEINHRKAHYTLERVFGCDGNHPLMSYTFFELADDLFEQHNIKGAKHYLEKAQKFPCYKDYPSIAKRVEKLECALNL